MSTQLETYGDVVNEVLQFGFNDGPSINKGRIERYVNEAQSQLARQVDAPEFLAVETLALVQGTRKYSLAAGLLRILDVYYPEMVARLQPLDLQQYDATAPALIEGPPMAYTVYGSELWLSPTPSTADSLEVRYVKNPALLVNESDVPVLDKSYLHLLVDYALARAFRAEDDLEAAQAHEARYRQDLAAYASDTQMTDRPRQLEGTWGGGLI